MGRLDHIIPVAHAHVAHEAIAGSRLEIIQGAGLPHTETPQRFLDAVLPFLAETPAASRRGPHLDETLRAGR